MEWIFRAILSLVFYLILVGVAGLVIGAARWLMVSTFQRLPRGGGARQALAFPMVALLSRERRARSGDAGSLRSLALLQAAAAGMLSWMFQGPLAALIFTSLFVAGTLTTIRE